MAGGGDAAGRFVRFIGSFEAVVGHHGRSAYELSLIVDFEGIHRIFDNALSYSDVSNGGGLPYDCAAIFKMSILAVQNNVADGCMK